MDLSECEFEWFVINSYSVTFIRIQSYAVTQIHLNDCIINVMLVDNTWMLLSSYRLIELSSLYTVIRTHHCISTVIDFETEKSVHNLFHDVILQNVYFNCISYLLWQCCDHLAVLYQICMLHPWLWTHVNLTHHCMMIITLSY